MERGAVGVIELDGGAEQALHRHPGAEEATIVLRGGGELRGADGWVAAREFDTLFAPVGAPHAARAGDGGMTLLVVLGGVGDPAEAGWDEDEEGGPEAVVIDPRSRPEVPVEDASQGFHGMSTLWLVDREVAEAKEMMIGRVRYAPGGLHDLHKHPGAGEFFHLLAGEGSHFGEGVDDIPVTAGEVVTMAAGEWHGFRNTGGELFAIFGFLGAADFPSAGYVLAGAAGSRQEPEQSPTDPPAS